MRAIIIAVHDGVQRRFACETEDGLCTVFSQLSGPLVEAGDIVSGQVHSIDAQTLDFVGEECRVIPESAMLSRADALALLREAPPAGSAGSAGSADSTGSTGSTA